MEITTYASTPYLNLQTFLTAYAPCQLMVTLDQCSEKATGWFILAAIFSLISNLFQLRKLELFNGTDA